MPNPFMEMLRKRRKLSFFAVAVIVLGWFARGILDDIGQGVRLAMWEFIVNYSADIYGFLVQNSLFFLGILFLGTIFVVAYLDSRKFAPIKVRGGLSIVRVYDRILEGQDRSWRVVFRNEEDEDMNLEMQVYVAGRADFKDMDWKPINLDQRFAGEWRIAPKKNDEREIARTKAANNGFWFAPSSGRERTDIGYYRFHLEVSGKPVKGHKVFRDSKDGYFVFRGGADLQFISDLPENAR